MENPLTQITTAYIMTLHAPLDPPLGANSDLQIYNVRPGGWVRGPSIRGEVIGPSGDWLRVMPNGARKLDVRLAIKADDGSIIFMSYTGRARASPGASRQARPWGRTSSTSSSPRPSRRPRRLMAGSTISSPSARSSPSTAATTATSPTTSSRCDDASCQIAPGEFIAGSNARQRTA
jgi:Protein of unknown function (DUF3237)